MNWSWTISTKYILYHDYADWGLYFKIYKIPIEDHYSDYNFIFSTRHSWTHLPQNVIERNKICVLISMCIGCNDSHECSLLSNNHFITPQSRYCKERCNPSNTMVMHYILITNVAFHIVKQGFNINAYDDLLVESST